MFATKQPINWLEKKCLFDDLRNPSLLYNNWRDTRPYVIKRCVMNEYRADNRTRFWKHFFEKAGLFFIIGYLVGVLLALIWILSDLIGTIL